MQRGRWIEDEAGFTALVAYQAECAVYMIIGFWVEADELGACLGRVGDDAYDGMKHPEYVVWHLHM